VNRLLVPAPRPLTYTALPSERRLSFQLWDVLAFALGTASWIEVQVIGRLYVGELFLFVCALGLPLLLRYLKKAGERRLLMWFFALGGAYFIGLVATDLYRHTAFADYARGWARALVYLADFAGLLVLGYRRFSRLVLFIAGTALSQLILIGLGAWASGWKFGYAYPATVAVLLLVDSRRRLLAFIAVALLGTVHLLLDFRSFGAFCVAAAALTYAKGIHPGFGARLRAALIAGATAVVFGVLYLSGAGLTGAAYDMVLRRQGSNVERAAGFVVAAEAIRQSPIIGYGSWAKSDEGLEAWAQLLAQAGDRGTAEEIQERALFSPAGAAIRAHSMLLQAWVEAGFVGLVFFGFEFLVAAMMFYGIVTVGSLGRYYGLVCFFGFWSLWAFIMSPFSGPSRLYTAMSLTLLFIFWSSSRPPDLR
jgi:O-antigen ligase